MRDRHQVRREGHAHAVAELLLDLRRVAVTADLVRRDRLVDGHEVLVMRRLSTGAADARLGVDHHVAQQARTGERGEREDRRGRIAARVGHQVGARDLVAVQLGQPVDGIAHQRRRGMGAVPVLVDADLVQPEVGRQVDDPHAALAQLGDHRARRPRAGRRPPRRRPAHDGRGRTARAPAARASAGGPRPAARRRPSARSRARARSAGAGAAARWPRRPRSRRRPAPRSAHPRGSPPSRSATAASIFARRWATSSSVSVRSSARNWSRTASETRSPAG